MYLGTTRGFILVEFFTPFYYNPIVVLLSRHGTLVATRDRRLQVVFGLEIFIPLYIRMYLPSTDTSVSLNTPFVRLVSFFCATDGYSAY